MNAKAKIAVGALAVVVVGATAVVGSGALSAGSPVPPPANLEVLQVGQDSITLGWGPTLPGELKAGAATPRALVVSWGASQDNHGAVRYSLSKNGQVIATGLTGLSTKVPIAKKETQFRACVWAVSTQGKSGPQMCATFNGQ